MRKPLFIGIAVHEPKYLSTLPGVLESLDEICAWARKSYDVISISDQDKAVTIDRIRSELTPRTDDGTPDPALLLDRSRIVVYFAGHGFAVWPDQYWVLSAGPDQSRERISANAFRDTLASYEPKQIAFISDACRVSHALQGAGDAVLDRLEGGYRNLQKDIFYSCLEGTASYAVPSSPNKPAHLVFSSALIRALSGPDGANLDKLLLGLKRRAVTSQSLSDYLEEKVPQIASDFDRIQVAQCDPGFRPLDHIYVEFGPDSDLEDSDPHFEIEALDLTGALASSDSDDADLSSVTTYIQSQFRNAASERLERQQGARLSLSRSEWRAPLIRRVSENLQRQRTHWNSFVGVVGADDIDDIGIRLSYRESQEPMSFGIADFDGRKLLRFDVGPKIQTEGGTACLSFGEQSVTFVPILPEMDTICVVAKSEGQRQGLEFLSWTSVWGDVMDNGDLHSAEALKGLTQGFLRSSDAPRIADQLRYVKHRDPMMGIVAAYLYNIAGDTDNVRRMAYYYVEMSQPIPFDIAMLAGLRFERNGLGFKVDVPSVAQDVDAGAHVPYFAKVKTPAVTGRVAGLVPILRIGWPYLRDSPHPFHRTCWQFIDDLAFSAITTFVGEYAVNEISNAFHVGEL